KESRNLLETTITKAETDEQTNRAELTLRQFEYYEASTLSYPGRTDSPANEEEALDLLENAGDRVKMVKSRYDLIESYKDNLSLRYPTDAFKRIDWDVRDLNELRYLADYILEQESDGGTVTDRVEELAQNEEPSELREFARLLQKEIENADQKE